MAGKWLRNSCIHISLQLRGLSDVIMSPKVVFSWIRKDSPRSLPKEVLRLLRMKGLNASISMAREKGWRGSSCRVMFDEKILVRSALHRWEIGRDDLRMS